MWELQHDSHACLNARVLVVITVELCTLSLPGLSKMVCLAVLFCAGGGVAWREVPVTALHGAGAW